MHVFVIICRQSKRNTPNLLQPMAVHIDTCPTLIIDYLWIYNLQPSMLVCIIWNSVHEKY